MNKPRPITVCMFTNLYPPVYSGSSTQCAHLAEELTRQGNRVLVITSHLDEQSPAYEVKNGVTVHRLPCHRLPRLPIALNFPWLNLTFTPVNRRRILDILQAEIVDVIHVHNHMFDMALHAMRVARQLKKPLIISIHTIIRHPKVFFNLVLGLADRLLLRPLIIRKASMVICPDRIIADYAQNTLRARQTVLIPYGITPPPSPDHRKMNAIREKYNLGKGPVILSLGHLHEVRNRAELVQALPEILTAYPELKVLIVGDVGTRMAHTLAARLGVLEHIIFTGAVPHGEIQEYIGLADVEAHWFDKSHPHRALGIAAQEVMAAGKVVIGDAYEDVYGEGVLQNGKNVILTDPSNIQQLASCIIDLLADTDRRKSIERSARQTIDEHFNWKHVAEMTTTAYKVTLEKIKAALEPA